MGRLFVLVGGLIVLVLTAALVGPYFIDWTSYRADFEREASSVLGRKVTVHGTATARLLPFPSVTFSDVAVGGGAGGKPAMTIDTFSMDAELAPFMRGEFLIFDMRMVRPKGVIDVSADGAIDWAMRPSAPFDASRISLENLTITEGRIEIRHQLSGRTHLLSEINTTVSAKSLAGPWRLDGSLRIDGGRATLSASTGTVGEDGAMRLRLKVEPALYPMTIETDGNVVAKGGSLTYAGEFKMLETVAKAAATGAGTAKPDPGYRVSATFSADNSRLSLDDARFETGPLDNPYTAEGIASVAFGSQPRFAIEAKGAQIRFDDTVTGEEGARLTLAQRLAALQTAFGSLPTPSIPGTVDVDLPAVLVGDTTIRDVKLSAEPGDGGWTLKSAGATLPGRTTLEADGFVSTGEDFGFTGSLLLAVGQPSGFAAWVSKDIDDAIRRLPAAGFSAKVAMTQKRQTFRDLELVLGNARFRGEIDRTQSSDARPSVLLKLDGDALDIDGLSAFASLFVSDRGETRFTDTDLDFQIKAGPVALAGMSAETLDTALRLRSGDLEIDRLSIGGFAGASLSATGRLKDFAKNPTGNLDASIVAVDLAPLVRLAAAQFPGNPTLAQFESRVTANPGLFADSKIDFIMSAAANGDGTTGVAVSLQGDSGGTSVSATLSGKGKAADLAESTLSLSVSARNDDATALIALAGLPALPLGMTGAGDVTLSAEGVPSRGLKTLFSLKGNEFLADFDGTAIFGQQGPSAKGKVRLEAADAEPWLMTTSMVLPGMGTGMPVALAADADYAAGLLVLQDIAGTIDEYAVSGDINGAIKDGTPFLTGTLALDALDLEPLAAMLVGQGTDDDGALWSDAPFQPKSSAPFAAAVDVTVGALAVGDLGDLYDASLSLRLDGEGLRIDDLAAKLFGGDLTGLFELKNTAGTGLMSGQFQLKGADFELALPGSGLSGTGNLSSTLSSSGKSAGGLVAALSGSGTATLGQYRIAGLNSDALPEFIAKADGLGRDIDAARTAAFATDIAAKGTFEGQAAELAFTVAGGVLRAPAITLVAPDATLTADLRGDINTGLANIGGAIAYRAGDEALAGSEPIVRYTVSGPLGAMVRSFDTEPLAQFLGQRALEREQARVEAMQAALLEKQRLRREVRYYAALQLDRDRVAEELRRAEEEARLKAAEEARVKAEADARLKAEAEELRLKEEARLQAEAEALRKQEEAARKMEETARKVEEASKREAERRLQLEAERAARDAETAEFEKVAEEARAQAAAAARAKEIQRAAEAAAQKQADDAAKRVAEQKEREAARAKPAPAKPAAAKPAAAKATPAKPEADAAARPAEEAKKGKLEPFTIKDLFKSLQGG